MRSVASELAYMHTCVPGPARTMLFLADPLTSGHARAGVECITFDCEADQELVWLLRTRPGGYAIVGGDSDFFVMEGVRYIPFQYVDIKHQHGEAQEDVYVRVFTPEVRH